MDATLEGVLDDTTPLDDEFVQSPYTLSQASSHGELTLQAEGFATATDGSKHRIQVTKTFSLLAAEDDCGYEVHYRLEQLPPNITFRFAVEMNFAGMPGGCADRYFYDVQGQKLGQLDTRQDLIGVRELGLVDEWLKLAVQLKSDKPANIWAYPVETVSGSDGGFEAVHQSVAVLPHWNLRANENGVWENTLRVELLPPNARE